MSHRVHPKIFRIRRTEDWSSRGFYERKFASFLEEDFRIREFLDAKIGKLGVADIETERSPNRISIIIFTSRPGLIIGRGGEGVEALRKELKKKILKGDLELKVEIREVKNPWFSASLVAQWMVGQIERRTGYRRVLKRALDKVMSQKGVKGARVEVSGRLNGIEISRKEWLKGGRLPRQTIRADIDYSQNTAFCTYGTVGIKVWIYKGDKFESEPESETET
ncbi:MAG: 30S ribosomal protein S3 [Patescibacteria group bacterium]|nr:30S ribosomal protein S3 [Patescibacteria group bacterium]